MSDPSERRREPTIDVTRFLEAELRVGTVRRAEPHPAARRPALVLTIDFGPALGLRTSSAQVVENYDATSLEGRQVVAVLNLPPRRVGGVVSEVLVLGALDPERGVVLLAPERRVADGSRIG